MKKNIVNFLLFLSIGHMSTAMTSRILPHVISKSSTSGQARFFSSSLVARELYDPYKILGLAKGANLKNVKSAYRNLAKQCHPNVAGGTNEAFYGLQTAYEVLKNNLKDENVFSCCKVAYTNLLVMGSRLDNYAEFVSPFGISKKLLPAQIQEKLQLKQLNHKEPSLDVFYINDQVGLGVKALEKIPKDSLIKPYVGTVEVVHHSECDARKYALTLCGTDTQLMIDAEFAGNETRFCNHSYDPNCLIKPILDEKTGFVQYWLVAGKDIQAGEEIVWNYGSDYWRTHNLIPVEKKIMHLYQDKHLTIYSCPKGGNANLYINDNVVNSGEFLAANHVVVGARTFIVIVVKKDDMAVPLIYLKENKSVKFVTSLSVFSQEEQAKVTECFYSAIKTLK